MKNKLQITIAFIWVLLLSANVSRAGFLIKKEKSAIEIATSVHPAETAKSDIATASSPDAHSTTDHHATTKTKKRSLISRIYHKIADDSAAISKGLYIVLAIFALGWLGMGINDDFQGYHWLISLLLYILGWLPGVIYTLVMMGDYY